MRNLEMIKFLLTKGADDVYGALEGAIEEGYLDIVKYLIETFNPKEEDLSTMRELALEYGQEDILRYLTLRK